ncbi:hypothetical protein SVIOM74S_08820 [Streptomyces violarus]
MPGSCPRSSVSPASSPTPMIVPIASKKPESSTVKTKRAAGEQADLMEAAEQADMADQAEVRGVDHLSGTLGMVRPPLRHPGCGPGS